MAKSTSIILVLLASLLATRAQEIPNPSFENPEIKWPIEILSPGQPGYVEAEATLRWDFGAGAGICPADHAPQHNPPHPRGGKLHGGQRVDVVRRF